MKRTRIKVCGVTRSEDVDACIRCGVDAIGFNLARGPRRITAEHARALMHGVPPFISCVALFMDQSEDEMHQALDRAPFTAVQLHGDEPSAVAARLSQRLPVIKAVRVASHAELQAWESYPCAALLLDTPSAGADGGGTGRAWDYASVAGGLPQRPIVLAGGLRPDTVAAAISLVKPWAVDVSSGVESAPGCKDHARLAAFVKACA